MMLLVVACVSIGVFAGLRSAVITTAAVVVAVVAAGLVHGSLVSMLPTDLARFVSSPTTWATQTSTFLVYVLAVVFMADSVMRRLKGSLRELGEHKAELVRTAEKLRDSERYHRLLAENVADVVFVQNPDFTLATSASPRKRSSAPTCSSSCDRGWRVR